MATQFACHSEESRPDRDDEESRTVPNTLRARFSDFRSDTNRTIGVQDSDLPVG